MFLSAGWTAAAQLETRFDVLFNRCNKIWHYHWKRLLPSIEKSLKLSEIRCCSQGYKKSARDADWIEFGKSLHVSQDYIKGPFMAVALKDAVSVVRVFVPVNAYQDAEVVSCQVMDLLL